MSNKDDDHAIPPYLRQWRGLSVRQGDRIVPAPPEDVAVAKSYAHTPEKGQIAGGVRLTILTARTRYQIDEPVRVIHVLEIVEPGHMLFVMGPKPVRGEYVDDRLATPSLIAEQDYDGPVLESPNVDFNYDVTSYRFDHPGTHRIYWEMNGVRSNTIVLEIVAP